MSGPICVAEPASPLAGSFDPAPSGCQAFAPRRPASRFPPVAPVVIDPTQQPFPYGGPVLLQVARELSDFHAVDPRTSLVRLDSLVRLPAVFPLAALFHQLLVASWTFGFAFRRARFGPFLRSLRSFTPPLLCKGQH